MAKCIVCGREVDTNKETIYVKNKNCYCHHHCYKKLTYNDIYLFSGSYYKNYYRQEIIK